MLSRLAIFLFVTCVAVASAQPPAKLIGKWHWQGVDASSVRTFRPDHTYSIESFGFDHHDFENGTWCITGDQLTLFRPDSQKLTYTVVKVTAATLILRLPEGYRERFSRIK